MPNLLKHEAITILLSLKAQIIQIEKEYDRWFEEEEVPRIKEILKDINHPSQFLDKKGTTDPLNIEKEWKREASTAIDYIFDGKKSKKEYINELEDFNFSIFYNADSRRGFEQAEDLFDRMINEIKQYWGDEDNIAQIDYKIFYSWQSDLPNSTNRGFIQAALEKAARQIKLDKTIEIEPVVDRDTLGIPGSPDISETIFSKIDKSGVFVCDVSIVNTSSQTRSTPNPNVLIELGYALKSMNFDRIIMILNRTYGDIDLLPFDLRQRRIITYKIAKEEPKKAYERIRLQGHLYNALVIIFKKYKRIDTSVL